MTINQKFDELAQRRQLALIPYVTCGYPSLRESLDIVRLAANQGADLIEIGVPFSDPIADGPTIQHASQTAIENGTTLRKIIRALRGIRLQIPQILMTYLNPILAYGPDRLLQDMTEARLAGMIIPDLPFEESTAFARRMQGFDLTLIQMVAPTSTDERIRLIAEPAGGFIYCVSTTGTTGSRTGLPSGLLPYVKRVKRIASKPVAVGFGISTPGQIRSLRDHADGVIVGSRLIEAMTNGEDLTKVLALFKNATKG